jgi:hypothetical protein
VIAALWLLALALLPHTRSLGVPEAESEDREDRVAVARSG